MVNESPFEALSHWWRVYDRIIKKRLKKPNPNNTWSGTESVGPDVVNAN